MAQLERQREEDRRQFERQREEDRREMERQREEERREMERQRAEEHRERMRVLELMVWSRIGTNPPPVEGLDVTPLAAMARGAPPTASGVQQQQPGARDGDGAPAPSDPSGPGA